MENSSDYTATVGTCCKSNVQALQTHYKSCECGVNPLRFAAITAIGHYSYTYTETKILELVLRLSYITLLLSTFVLHPDIPCYYPHHEPSVDTAGLEKKSNSLKKNEQQIFFI